MENLIQKVFTSFLICLVGAVSMYFFMFRPIDLVHERARKNLGDIKNVDTEQLIRSLCLQQSVCKGYRKTLNDCALAAHIDECVRIKNPNNTFGKYVCDENGESVLTKQYRDVMEVCYVEDFLREIRESAEKKLQNERNAM
jgi:hypothetical protein